MYTLPPLPYAYDSLEPWIDAETMKLHHDKHHQAYVDNLNKTLEGQDDLAKLDISELIIKLDKVPEDTRTKVRNNAGGHFNHTIFWELLSPNPDGKTGTTPETDLSEAISNQFDSMEKFQEAFSASSLGRFGSGWAWLISEEGKLKIEDTPNQDNPLMRDPKVNIILGLDLWEHAYYLKYQNRRAEYIKNWWNIVNWRKVEELFKAPSSFQ